MRTAHNHSLEDPIICGQPIQGSKHICVFVDSQEEQYDVLMPFLRQGFEQSDMILSILDPGHADYYHNRCTAAGIDLTAHEVRGNAPVLRHENTYLADDYFSADRMINLIEKTLADARKNGYPRVRGFGEMHWALTGLPGTEELVEYESRLNNVCDIYPQDPLICVYDLNHFSGRVLMDILCTHPKVILNGKIIENEYYMSPNEFLSYYRHRRARDN